MIRNRVGVMAGAVVLAAMALPMAAQAQPVPMACGPGGGAVNCHVEGSDTIPGNGGGNRGAAGNRDGIMQDNVETACQVVWDFDGDGYTEGTNTSNFVPAGWEQVDDKGCVIRSPQGEEFVFRVRLNSWVRDDAEQGPPPEWCEGYNPAGRWWRGVVAGTQEIQPIWGDDATSEGVCPPPGDVGPSAERIVRAWLDEQLVPGEIALTPPADNPDSLGVVGMPVWMWYANPTVGTVGSEEPVTVTEGPVTVSIEVKVASVDFDMGDGNVVTCHYNPETGTVGTPYSEEYADNLEASDCMHVYETTSAGQEGEAFTITATTMWDVTWSVENSAGTETGQENPQTDPSTTTLRVGEVQTLRVG